MGFIDYYLHRLCLELGRFISLDISSQNRRILYLFRSVELQPCIPSSTDGNVENPVLHTRDSGSAPYHVECRECPYPGVSGYVAMGSLQ